MRKKKKKKKELIENSIQKNTDLLDFLFVEVIFVDGWQNRSLELQNRGRFPTILFWVVPPFPVNSHHQEEFPTLFGDWGSQPKHLNLPRFFWEGLPTQHFSN